MKKLNRLVEAAERLVEEVSVKDAALKLIFVFAPANDPADIEYRL